jgi:MoxR-like ATPase
LDQVEVAPIVQETLLDIAQRVRDDERVRQGISTRALVQAIPALQTRALLRQRDFVSSDDLEAMLVPLFAHRLMLAGGVDDPAGIVLQASSLPLENAARYTLRQ